VAVTVGKGDTEKFPTIVPKIEIFNVANSTTHVVDAGTEVAWSPDDRFISYFHLVNCGAAICSGEQMIWAVGSGQPIMVAPIIRYISSDAHYEWRIRPGGYIFGDWLLDSSGHVVDLVVGPQGSGYILSWSADGRFGLRQDFTKSPFAIQLRVVSAAPGDKGNLVSSTTPVNMLPGDCFYENQYVVTWGHNSRIFVSSLPPPTGCGPATGIFVYRLGSGSGSGNLISVDLAGAKSPEFTTDDSALIVTAPAGLYRYDVQSHTSTRIVSGTDIYSFDLRPTAPAAAPQPSDDLIAALEHLRVTTDQSLTFLRGGEEQRAQAVRYFQQHLGTDAASGIATVLLDALSVKGAVKLWQGPLHDFIADMSLTNTKALLKAAAKDTSEGLATDLVQHSYDRGTAVLIDWLIRADPRATKAFDHQITLDQQQIAAAAKQTEATLRAHPPTAAATKLLLAQLKAVTNANLSLAQQLDAAGNLLTSSYALRSSSDHDTTIFDNFFADTALYWGLTALSIPVGGWGGLAYQGTKTAFQSLQTLGALTEDAQMTAVGAATALSAIALARQVTVNADTILADGRAGAAKETPAAKVITVAGSERSVLRRGVTQAVLRMSVQNSGPVEATYQAVVTYQHTHYTLPIPQAAYPVEYLAKSPETRIAAGRQGTLTVDFLIGGSGTPPSDGTSGQIDILAQADGLTYLVAKQTFTWQPHAS
jgi:hypothetical protein